MAPVYDFRHVEIDKIGRGKRVTRPPGGECSDIFGVDQADGQVLGKTNGSSPTVQNGRRLSDTQNRLFGPPEQAATPRRSSGVNRMKSSIFSGDSASPGSPASRTPSAKKSLGPVRRNPITGEMHAGDGPTINGCNGHYSSPATPEVPVANGHRPPPGGRSSGIF